MFGRKRSAEEPSNWEVERRAGKVLCAFAGLPHTRNTARYLAEVVRYDRLLEVNSETRAGLETALLVLGDEGLADLIADILD